MLKILLTDDESQERDGIKFLLEKYQFPLEVHEAANGKAAYEYIENHRIDILFTDVKMPYMDGLELSRKARERDKDIVIIIFSAYSEFEYARKACDVNAVNYLLKPIEVNEFKAVMNKAISICNEQKNWKQKISLLEKADKNLLLFQMINSRESISEILERLQSYDVHLEHRYMQLMSIETESNYFEQKEAAFGRLLEKSIDTKFEYINRYPNLSYLLFYDSKPLAERVERSVKRIYAGMSAEGMATASVIVGKRFYNTHHLLENIEEMKKWGEETFGSYAGIIYMAEIGNAAEAQLQDMLHIRECIFKSLDEKNREAVREQTELYVERLNHEKAISSLYLKYIFLDIVKALYGSMGIYDQNVILKTTDSIIKCTSLQEMQMILKRIFEETEFAGGGEAVEEGYAVAEVKKIIRNEYREDLSLDMLAERVGLASSYLSYVFKQETGNNLIKYLTDYRMGKARELLEQGKMKIVDIGRACGYQNQPYFNRLFKNVYGVTPKQYRENTYAQ